MPNTLTIQLKKELVEDLDQEIVALAVGTVEDSIFRILVNGVQVALEGQPLTLSFT